MARSSCSLIASMVIISRRGRGVLELHADDMATSSGAKP
jgi:hypothetical protein